MGQLVAASGYIGPAESGGFFERYDQGIDWRGTPGTNVLSIGPGQVDRISLDAGGFGKAVYWHLTSGPGSGRELYVGHAEPQVSVGQKTQPGTPIARLLSTPLGNAPGDSGHTEVGVASPGGSGPLYPLAGSDSGEGGLFFAGLLNQWGIGNVSGVNPYGSAVTGKVPAPGAGQVPADPGKSNLPPEYQNYPVSPGCPPADHPKNLLMTCHGCKDPFSNTGLEGLDPSCDCIPTESWDHCYSNKRPVRGAVGAISSTADFLALITSAAFWLRAGEIILGVILVGLGLVIAGRKFGVIGKGSVPAAAASAVGA